MLKGKAALVTGSTGGIGFAIARALAEQGCDVMLNGFAELDAVAKLTAELERRFNVRAAHHAADLQHPEQVSALVRDTRESFGSLDILVNNAVVRHFSPVDDFSVDDWNRALAVNLSAPFHAIRLTLPYMKKAGWGRIINLASVLGLFATPERADYVTTKTALIGLSRAVAVETLAFDVTCNAICPGAVLTPASAGRIEALMKRDGLTLEQAQKAFVAARQPAGRFVSEESVAAMAVFLCGPNSRDITGCALPVDAGWTAGR
jgi:3-hydroxybutyrate dehydrogenase